MSKYVNYECTDKWLFMEFARSMKIMLIYLVFSTTFKNLNYHLENSFSVVNEYVGNRSTQRKPLITGNALINVIT